MTKHDAEILASLQGKPFDFVPRKTAERLINAGMVTVASVQIGEEDAKHHADDVPVSCTLEGFSYGRIDAATTVGNVPNDEG